MRALLIFAMLGVAGSAMAEPLGDAAHQYVLTTDARLDYQRDTTTKDGVDVTSSAYAFRFAADYTLRAHLTAGGMGGFDGSSNGEDRTRTFSIGARLGWMVPLGGHTTWWPRAGVAYATTTIDESLPNTGLVSTTIKAVRLDVSAPFVFQPYDQVLVGVGPTYTRDLTAKTGPNQPDIHSSGWGIHILFGLWFY